MVSVYAAKAQGYNISLQSNYKSGIAYLTYYMGKDFILQDSSAVSNTGRSLFKSPKKLAPGIYSIIFPGKRLSTDFLIEKEQNISIVADTNKLAQTKITGSPANVDFKKTDISFFRHFPKVSIGLDELQVIGTDDFATDTLLYAKRLDATINIMSFIRGRDMAIYNIYLESPRINAIINKDGLANWDIIKKSADKTGEDPVSKPFIPYEFRAATYIRNKDVPSYFKDVFAQIFKNLIICANR